MYAHAVIVTLALILAPLGARAADLVVWWEKGYYAQEDEALREIIAAFEQKTGKQVELVLQPQAELPDKLEAALEADQPPDFTFGLWLDTYIPKWALEDRLVDLTDAVGSFSNLFDPNQLDRAMLLNAKTGQRALYGVPMGQIMDHVHVWKSLLEHAGFSLDDIPKEWDGFWSFWCDQVQPAVRRATGRDDIWGIGLSMSAEPADTDGPILPVRRRVRCGLRDPRGQTGHRRPGDQAAAGQGDGQLYGRLPQGLHPARLGDLGRCRQQQGVPGPDGHHDTEHDTLDPGCAQARASR